MTRYLPHDFIRMARSENVYAQQAALLFMAACKTNQSDRVAEAVERILLAAACNGDSPLEYVGRCRLFETENGCGSGLTDRHLYDLRAKYQIGRTLTDLAAAFCHEQDLRGVLTEERVRCFYGIGPKLGAWIGMAFCGDDGAVLDVHVLAFLKAAGVPRVPANTPQDPKEYERLADAYKAVRDGFAVNTDDPAEADLQIWNLVREHGAEYAYRLWTMWGPRLPAEKVA